MALLLTCNHRIVIKLNDAMRRRIREHTALAAEFTPPVPRLKVDPRSLPVAPQLQHGRFPRLSTISTEDAASFASRLHPCVRQHVRQHMAEIVSGANGVTGVFVAVFQFPVNVSAHLGGSGPCQASVVCREAEARFRSRSRSRYRCHSRSQHRSPRPRRPQRCPAARAHPCSRQGSPGTNPSQLRRKGNHTLGGVSGARGVLAAAGSHCDARASCAQQRHRPLTHASRDVDVVQDLRLPLRCRRKGPGVLNQGAHA